MSAAIADLAGFEQFDFTHGATTKRVFRKGQGPGVLLMHELPGMTPECVALAERIAAKGMTVYVPLFFGEPGRSQPLTGLLRVCVSREFNLLAKNGRSSITDWLRPLCQRIHLDCGGRGIGVIGMCLTGGFALSMMIEPCVVAPVTSQPSLPLAPLTAARKAALGIPDEDIEAAAARVAQSVDVLGWRFTRDRICPSQRFDTLKTLLGDRFLRTEIASGADSTEGISASAHSVLTFPDQSKASVHDAIGKTIDFLAQRLV